MRREMLKRLLATTMASVFIINGLTITKVDAFTDKNNQVSISLPKLNPAPKNIEVNEGILTITSTVNIQGKDLADEDAIRVLKEFLSENNIVINETYDESSTTLIVGEVEDDIKEMDEAKERIGVSGTEELKDEGYLLAVDSNDGSNGTILIEGKDEDGTFYGVKTLTQLVTNTGSKVYSNDVVITDEPTMKTRGIVEGFYGTPWTQEDRLNQIRFYGENKMNTYIYAPKDDPYHRDQWRDPYPQEEMARMQELINTANENKVDFVFAISPGKDIDMNSEADYKALVDKCESLYDMGVRSFAILWDDIFTDDGAGQAACRYGGLRAGDLRRRGARAAFLLRAAPPSRSAGRAAALTRGGESGGIEQSGMRVGRTRGVPVSEFGGNEYRDGVLPECKKESLWLSFFMVR